MSWQRVSEQDRAEDQFWPRALEQKASEKENHSVQRVLKHFEFGAEYAICLNLLSEA